MSKESNNYVPVLDSLRAFAAISVCLFHFVCTTTDFIYTNWIREVFNAGQFGVHMFFVISGFVIPWAMYNANYKLTDFFKFFFKRLIRLEPPYVFSIILALLFLYLRETLSGRENSHIQVSLPQVMLHFGYLIPFFDHYQWLNPVYWTLAIEFQYYILIALLFIPLVRSKWFVRSVIYMTVIVLAYFTKPILIFSWLPIFLLGILTFLYRIQTIQKLEFALAFGLTTAFCLYKYPIESAVYCFLPVAAILYFSKAKIKILDPLGKMSYSIYLIHPILGASLINYFSHFTYGSIYKFMLVGAGLAITLIGAWVTYMLIEKPSKMFSGAIKYK